MPFSILDVGKVCKTSLQFLVGGDVIGHLSVVEFLIGIHIEVAGAGQTEYNGFLDRKSVV